LGFIGFVDFWMKDESRLSFNPIIPILYCPHYLNLDLLDLGIFGWKTNSVILILCIWIVDFWMKDKSRLSFNPKIPIQIMITLTATNITFSHQTTKFIKLFAPLNNKISLTISGKGFLGNFSERLTKQLR